VWEAPVRWHEGQARGALAQNSQNTNIDPVLKVLLSEVLWNRALFPDRANIEFLARSERQLAFRGKGSDASKDSLIRRFELHQYKLTVHRDALEVTPVREDKVSVEFQTAFLLEAAEYANYLLTREQIKIGHVCLLHRYRCWAASVS
jgi:hypothetical protein